MMPANPETAKSTTPLSLLQRARLRDEAAWRRLVDLYKPLVLYWIRRSGVRPDDGEDIAQEVFAAAAQSLDHFQRDRPGDTFRGWLRGIARHGVLHHFRKQKDRPAAAGGSVAL